MKIDLKILFQAIKDQTHVKVSYETLDQISVNGIRITIIGNLAKCSKFTIRFESLKGLLADLRNAGILSPGIDINLIRARYNQLEIESNALVELIAKYSHE